MKNKNRKQKSKSKVVYIRNAKPDKDGWIPYKIETF